jgi:hypothetical protein
MTYFSFDDDKFVGTYEEDSDCPQCGEGWLGIPEVRGCTCHLGNPPCSQCTTNVLVCNSCAWTTEDDLDLLDDDLFEI